MADHTPAEKKAARYVDVRMHALIHYLTTVPATDGEGITTPAHANKLVQAMVALQAGVNLALAKIDQVDEAVVAQLTDEFKTLTDAANADAMRDALAIAAIENTPEEVVALLAAVPASEAASTLVASVGAERARSIAQAVLEAVNGAPQ